MDSVEGEGTTFIITLPISEKIPVVLVTGWDIGFEESKIMGNFVDSIIQRSFTVNQILGLVRRTMIQKNQNSDLIKGITREAKKDSKG